jgi:hypothetical protein
MARMIKKFNLKDDSISVDSIVSVNDVELIYEIIRGIFYGIAKGQEEVALFEISTAYDIKTFSVKRSQWSKSLNKCLEAMVENEDYETCAEIKKALSILSNI